MASPRIKPGRMWKTGSRPYLESPDRPGSYGCGCVRSGASAAEATSPTCELARGNGTHCRGSHYRSWLHRRRSNSQAWQLCLRDSHGRELVGYRRNRDRGWTGRLRCRYYDRHIHVSHAEIAPSVQAGRRSSDGHVEGGLKQRAGAPLSGTACLLAVCRPCTCLLESTRRPSGTAAPN